MATSELQQTVGSLAKQHPAWIPEFERLGIDYCCHGRDSFTTACEAKQLDPATVLESLRERDARAQLTHVDPESLDTAALINHLVNVHHAYLREQLPILDRQLQKVRDVHGSRHPELRDVVAVFQKLRAELESHLMKEECVLFPWALGGSAQRAGGPCGDIRNPILVMEREHLDVHEALNRIRALTHDLQAPADACVTYQAAFRGLAELESDLHQHVHEENNVLFRRLIENTGVQEDAVHHHSESENS